MILCTTTQRIMHKAIYIALLVPITASSKGSSLNMSSRPGALNSCMHTFFENNNNNLLYGLTHNYMSLDNYGILDPQFGVLRIDAMRADRIVGGGCWEVVGCWSTQSFSDIWGLWAHFSKISRKDGKTLRPDFGRCLMYIHILLNKAK